MANPTVYYVGPFAFPWGEAASRRVYGNAAAMLKAGWDVTVIAGRTVESLQGDVTEVATPWGQVRSVPGVDEVPEARVPRAVAWAWSMGSRTVEVLNDLEVPDAVIVYGGSFPYLRQLIPWCRRRNVRLILDMVEWYDPTTLPGGRFGPVALGYAFSRRFQHGRADGVIAISSFLENYYRGKGLDVARVPPTVVAAAAPGRSAAPIAASFAYLGTPGAKDDLAMFLRAAREVAERGVEVEVLVAGPSVDELCGMLDVRQLPAWVKAFGRVAQWDVAEILGRANFTVLLREDKRSSRAGFSTKFVESMTAGVPVLANITSDLGDYLEDGVNGLVVDYEQASIAEAITAAARLSDNEVAAMLRSAAEAGERFEASLYSARLGELLRQ